MTSDDELSARARALAGALEPVAGQVYFSPECHEGYERLGFGGSPGRFGDVAAPDGPAYFCSRGSVMGQVPGEVIAAAFGVFNPEVVVPAVASGWARTDAATICAARTAGAVGQLRASSAMRPPASPAPASCSPGRRGRCGPRVARCSPGLASLDLPGDPMGDAWRHADMLREYRGDAHVAAWTAAGFDATEIGLLTEPYWGLPLRTYVRTRAWTDTQLDAAEARLVDRGLLRDGDLTPGGRAEREAVETATDRQCRPIVDALGDDLDELLGILGPWGKTIRAGAGYPASGPHDLADAAVR